MVRVYTSQGECQQLFLLDRQYSLLYTCGMKKAKPIQMNFRLHADTRAALRNLSSLHKKSMTEVFEMLVEKSAKRQKCWPEDL